MEIRVHAVDGVERARADHQAGRRGLIDIHRRRIGAIIQIAREVAARPGIVRPHLIDQQEVHREAAERGEASYVEAALRRAVGMDEASADRANRRSLPPAPRRARRLRRPWPRCRDSAATDTPRQRCWAGLRPALRRPSGRRAAASCRARLTPPAKPRFVGDRTSVTSGKRRATASALPSSEALSTTIDEVGKGREGVETAEEMIAGVPVDDEDGDPSREAATGPTTPGRARVP